MERFEKVKAEVIHYMPKEYYCHLQFVHKMAIELMKTRPCNREVVEVASIFHDYGRIDGGDNDNHATVGADKVQPFLREVGYDDKTIAHIARCVLRHNKTGGFESIEEEIVANADQMSKVVYHEAFMLLVRKSTFEERARWALKYLDKGFKKTTFTDAREKYRHMYIQKRQLFEQVLVDTQRDAVAS